MQGFIGDRISECKLWLFCDAGSGEHDRKSTSGCAMYLAGPNTYYPLNAFSKKQTSITMSSTESEVVSANHGVRAQGLPSLSLWIFLWRQVEIDPANHKVRPKTPCPVKIDGVIARVDPELDETRYGDNSGGRTIANLQGLNVGLRSQLSLRVTARRCATPTGPKTSVSDGSNSSLKSSILTWLMLTRPNRWPTCSPNHSQRRLSGYMHSGLSITLTARASPLKRAKTRIVIWSLSRRLQPPVLGGRISRVQPSNFSVLRTSAIQGAAESSRTIPNQGESQAKVQAHHFG